MRIERIFIVLAVFAAVLTFCGGCGKGGGDELKNYKIYRVEGDDSASLTQFLMDLAEEKAGVSLKNSADDQGSRICLLMSESSANEYGLTLEQLQPKAFVILRREGQLFLLSPTEEGLRRACEYLFYRLVAEEGTLLLKDGERYADTGNRLKEAVYVGERLIDEYVISYEDKEAIPACEELQFYIHETCGRKLPIEKEKEPEGLAIRLLLDEDLAKGEGRTSIQDGRISISGSDAAGLYEEMCLFVNTYLGWMEAGQESARISSVSGTVHVPWDVEEQEAWMPEREAIVVLWNVNYTRGVNLSEAVSLKNNLLDYTEEQLYEYVKMLKFCGFTGVQVTDMCSAWAGADSYRTTHEKLRMIADAAHSLDMKFTLWVWGAKFSGFAWTDDTVSYEAGESGFAYDNPQTLATFEKYYSIYAELADCCDRVISHYYDPGELTLAEDVAFFAKMLRDKFLAVNPDIDFGVSCWVDAYNKGSLVRALGNDITLYEGVFRDENGNEKFRKEIAAFGTRLGTWAWNTCEMEIDQMAQMNFNMDIIRETYQTSREYDGICKPTYWSEMDSNHVLNAFSLYCAGQLLVDPDMDPDILYARLSEAVVGQEYGDAFVQMLRLIQDARSGSTWSQYWWSSEDYILKSEVYPAESILERCNTYIPILQEMIDKGIESRAFPLPIGLEEVLRMMLPHLEQIKGYAQFRIGLGELEEEWRQGAFGESLAERLREIAKPIPDYNTVVGVWGQVEARAQREMVLDFCRRTQVEVPIYPEWDRQRKNYIYGQMATDQKGLQEPLKVWAPYYQYGLAFGEETERLVQELTEEGLLIRNEDGSVSLVDWERYRYHFD
ncbi:hypothetical protein D7X48_05155 [bacterium D16-50]|nr:hypothetical protein D7X48_05155 [bacterium D16-50]